MNTAGLARYSSVARQTRQAAGCAALCAAVLYSLLAAWNVSEATAGRQTCFGRTATIVGTPGDDRIRGTNQKDIIVARGGNDSIRSRQGKDFVCTGAGNDTIHAAEGVNYMNGGPGDDWLDGRPGRGNVSIGGRGQDFIQAEGDVTGGPGSDEIESFGFLNPLQSPFADRANGGGGRDSVHGGSSDEVLRGGLMKDRIRGGAGNDELQGNTDNDRLHGESGNDDIDGGSGRDVCVQGPGTGDRVNCES